MLAVVLWKGRRRTGCEMGVDRALEEIVRVLWKRDFTHVPDMVEDLTYAGNGNDIPRKHAGATGTFYAGGRIRSLQCVKKCPHPLTGLSAG
jgi:hypothetical protein